MNIEKIAGIGSQEHKLSDSLPEWLRVVRLQVESLKFGTVLITVHDSKVVQIERLERTRLDRFQPGA
jgi:hypothetical protein